LLENIPTESEALAAVEKVVAWFQSLERKCRIGKVVEEFGLDAIREAIFGK
jgi:NAD(P)H-nitrite reductase large subunit